MSETTNREDTSQNRLVIEWLSRVDPDRPFLKTVDSVWSYGQTLSEVVRRVTSEVAALRPGLDSDSVFDCLAAIAGDGALLLGPSVEESQEAVPAETALVVFTSGTGGRPKGVRLTMDNLEAASVASTKHLGHDGSDTWLLAMPLHHVAGMSILVRSIYAGGSVRLLPGFDVDTFSDAMGEGVTMVSVVPTMLHRILEHDAGPYHGLRAVLVGGGPIPGGLLRKGAEAGLPVLPTYGMTETFGQVATLRPGSPLESRAHPLPGIRLRIEPDGRIAVKGRQLFAGYLGAPDRDDDWFITSDLGDLDDDGALRVTGRVDAVIVTGGENVDPVRVEVELLAHPGVDDVVVVGIPDEKWGEIVAAAYVGSATEDELVSDLGERLPSHMVPSKWLSVDAIPTNVLGKPNRSAARTVLEG
ncbi:MAG: AMP-binding protein [Acidimicrobiia bacterium]